MEHEIWRDIKGYEGIYQVSNLGEIKSIKKARIIKGSLDSRGYPHIQLFKNGKMKCFKTHRLIAINFIPNPDNKPTVNHKNGDRLDSRVANLEWSTHKENINHAIECGLRVRKPSKNVAVTKEQKSDILLNRGIQSIRQLSDKHKLKYETVWQVISRNA